MFRISTLFTLAMFLAANTVYAKDLYVNAATGNDSTSYANNSIATPWRSLGRAVWGSTSIAAPNTSEAARAGDTVIVAAGTYGTSATTNSRFTPIYNPANSGNSSAPITFRADGDVYLTASAGAQPIIGTYQKSHIIWDGFILNEVNIPTTADTGPLVVWNSDNVTIQNAHIIGRVVNWGDNHNGMRIEYAHDIVIRNNQIEGFHDSDNGMNATCLMTYDTYHLLLEHNECSDSTTGFFIKGFHGTVPQQDVVMRFNYIHNTGNAIQFGIVGGNNPDGSQASMSYVYQNLITDASLGGIVFIGYNNTTPARITVANNTLNRIGTASNTEAGGILFRPDYLGYRELVFRNNLITNGAAGVNSWNVAFNSNPSATTFSHNNYYGNGASAYIAYRNYNLSGWQSTYTKDTTGTTTLDPQYLSSTDYRLASTSPVRNSGLDILDLNGNGSTSDSVAIGAYVTGDEVMGITSGTLVAAPNPPTNLQVLP